jgi:3-hydroxybutyryl-CoA dehydrogenase
MAAVEIRTITVLGAGTMGHGIAQLAARAGCEVRLYDVDPAAIERGLKKLRESLEKAVQKGKLAAAELEEVIARVHPESRFEPAVEGADLVVEAAPEELELKRRLFARASEYARPDTILASNTSSLPVTEIATAARNPERVIGLHFFNPPPIMPLLEIVVAERTAPLVVVAARAFGARLGKEVVVVRDSPGFATSRLGLAVALEAMRMLEEGVASAEEIDRAMELGYGYPMGPLKLTDHVGLDVRLKIAEHLCEELGERFRPPQVLRRLVRAGKLGRKSGEGFYKY